MKKLEGQLEEAQSYTGIPAISSVQPNRGGDISINDDKNDEMELHEEPRHVDDGVWANNTNKRQVEQRHFYGSSSQFFFISNISSSLGLQEQQVHPNALSNVFTSPGGLKRDVPEEEREISRRYEYLAIESLTRAQESRFLGLYWPSYNCIFPIIDEASFRRHYESLWTSAPNGKRPGPRKASPIVDIVMALSMQHGMTLIPPQSGNSYNRSPPAEPDISTNDPSIAGREYYSRCQASLTTELERPSISTVQCHVLSAIYLQNASFLNMAQNSLAIAIQLAYILGMNRQPSHDLTRCEQELRRRLWWAIFSLESKICIAQGRPSLIDTSHMTIGFPRDDKETERASTVHFGSPHNDITWLSCQAYCVKLIAAARTLHASFHKRYNDMMNTSGGDDLSGNPAALEELARFLLQKLQHHFESWAKNVPQGLIIERKRDGTPLSADRSALKIDLATPQWLQRQRIVLELNYHDRFVTACRSFIQFSAPAKSTELDFVFATPQPIVESHCVRCASHAVECTSIIDQTLRETDLLTGWYDAYKFQWNAALALVGFCLAYPIHGQTTSVRRALDDAIGVFEHFGASMTLARSAASVMRDLAAKVDDFIRRAWVSTSLQNDSSNIGSLEIGMGTEKEKTQEDNLLEPNAPDRVTNGDALAPEATSSIADGFTNEFPVDLFNFSETQFLDGNGSFTDLWSDFITGL